MAFDDGKLAIPAEGYTWINYTGLNHKIYDKYKGTELKKAVSLFTALIKKHNDDELFTKKKYPLTGTTSLGPILFLQHPAITIGG
ncbi:hypothetical protein FACS189476_03710 [Spirochaetia bacterium]|nr:hypothetical protein FACS189476_03710 [Spirochaetia bacterium]